MKYSVAQIFVPGGMPKRTYVARAERRLEERLTAAKDNLCKLVTVTGTTKSGKTCLVSKIFPRDESIWVDGGTIGDENDFWSFILNELDGYTDSDKKDSVGSEYGIESDVEGEGGIPFVAKGKGKIGGSYKRSRTKDQGKSLTLTPRAAAISQLRNKRMPVIIDDFHYLNRNFQGNIIRALKPLIFEGIPVIVIAIPHRRYDVVKVEREMTGRLEPINVPIWESQELILIPHTGFPLLNIEVNKDICNLLAKEAYGSPHLMQEFCREIANANQIRETLMRKKEISSLPNGLFEGVAEQTGKVIFDKLAKGPRQRADRIQRKLKNGQTADIYKVILLGLSELQPGLETVEYENLRSSVKAILADNIPQANEITRVLEQMSNIASSDESSTPVLDWEKDEQQLHITDPFFAFFLKWGVKPAISVKSEIIELPKEVYISYAWGSESENIVDKLVQTFAEHGILAIHDKKDLDYKGSIKDFEKRIKQGQYVILVISDRYLRSEHCMFELIELDINRELRERVFPIVLSDARIYEPVQRLAYIKYWDKKINQSNQAIKQIDVITNLDSIIATLDRYARIRASIDHLPDFLSDMNALTPDKLTPGDFSLIVNIIDGK